VSKDQIATATATIDANREEVWSALVSPEAIRKYMFGANVETDWKEGSPITWSGTWEGKSYQDKGRILRIEPGSTLRYSHYSPLSKLPDEPENYHTVTINLTEKQGKTVVTLDQDHNPTAEARDHSQKNWEQMLARLKEVVEK
jgi:uncharacterized protein YndB with AHSA1/START domain